MTRTVTVEPASALIEVRYRGLVHVAERQESLDEVTGLITRTGFRRVLVDFSGAQAATDDFESINRFASRLTRALGGAGIRLAYLAANSWQLNSAVETLARARGLAFERFATRADALAWLTAGDAGGDRQQ